MIEPERGRRGYIGNCKMADWLATFELVLLLLMAMA
jgi:hypothetical protein